MADINDSALLSVEQMYAADRAAIGGGTPGLALMEAAGTAIAEQVVERWPKRPLAVLCGPGNNGGDGLVVARLLAARGWPVRLALLGEKSALRGDAAVNGARWRGRTVALEDEVIGPDDLIIDALFGAGLSRPLDGAARRAVETINGLRLDCLAVDVPSGVDGDSGLILGGDLGVAPRSVVTVTFFRRKPGHLLLPGKDLAGQVVVADIGIPDGVLKAIEPDTFANGPALWGGRFPRAEAGDNKYSRGHAVVVGGAEMTGAARLAATAARRMGAGLVSIAAPPAAFDIYAAAEPGNLVKALQSASEFAAFLDDRRKNAVLVGPGCGVSASAGERTRNFVLTALKAGKPVVLDADALTVFAADPDVLFAAIAAPAAGPVLLSPHEGEFKRLFDLGGDKLSRARRAAGISGAVVLLKGADTVIAAPDGRAAINEGAPPSLATAGAGDVLAGFICGLLARGMGLFDAACAGAWLHGRAAASFGPGLIAEDLAGAVAAVLTELDSRQSAKPGYGN